MPAIITVMVIAYHLILGAYGFWLPNDPRGSWSDYVGSRRLLHFGGATKADTKRSVATVPHDIQKRYAAKEALKLPPVRFTGVQARAIARGIGNLAGKSQIMIYACAVLPDHSHVVIARHDYEVEKIANLLKGEASKQILLENLHPFASFTKPGKRPHTMWARGHWKVFLNSADDVHRAIRYVEQNPIKDGKPPQRWWFVSPFDG